MALFDDLLVTDKKTSQEGLFSDLAGTATIESPDTAMPSFDPEGSGYDDKTASTFIEANPLTVPKPTEYQGDYVTQDDAYQAWVWHKDRNDYVKHGGSLDPKTGMVLKGRNHPTWNLMAQEEERLGNEVYKGEDGRYYSRKKQQIPSFDPASIADIGFG